MVGWRESLALPDLGVDRIKVKVDTGARTSALHAFELESFTEAEVNWGRFVIHPFRDDGKTPIQAKAPLRDRRRVRSSNGRTERRPVILTTVERLGQRWPIELSLSRRDALGFRMLLGRQAIRKHALVDPGKSLTKQLKPQHPKGDA